MIKNDYLKFDSLAYYFKSNEQNLSNVFDSVSELEMDPFIFPIHPIIADSDPTHNRSINNV